ncbi:CPBP family intramembrane metalloprotease [Salmonella enterica subsp. enterica]|uniref:CPBP family intramembrane metalloprotease n=1 Tax=Salmonella enterica TaxID=28901 RepID=A0A5U4CZY1_SALER|nr:CPBP family intramembrane metalloprotease [Salmonella enterica subsp. enterica]EBP8539863.1 CPBP family intramembrane metalloprotease [Salmonella enterica]EBR2768196.1 CPBP family intramembrane metalloprotease [Salmonella enterica]EBT4152119.1 CPBP family intramembrane metalloprotease [Salmonella enterica subsp. enterica]EED9464953.1 CPBP family intramembrane metalloprotease [Salmonella enterica subsp. enterica serovar Abaetetuba]
MDTIKYSSDYIRQNKSVTGCFAMFMLFFGITFTPLFFKSSGELWARGFMVPILITLEFLLIVPLYYFFFRSREGLGTGTFRLKTFLALFLVILLIQYLFPYLSGVSKTENWSVSQMALENYVFWLNAVLIILAVPVYEEIVFRGCLFNVFLFWFRNNVYGAAVAVALLFSAVHLQYTDIRSFIMLFLVSLTLTVARVKSRGLLMPIALHILMNTVVTGTQYAALVFFTHHG